MNSNHIFPHQSRSVHSQHGFALVIALSLMAFVLLLLLSITTLVQVETTSAEISKTRLIAQANARLALMIALGELQKEMGPDQRITANASILDSDTTTPEVDGVAHPHWLGTWNAWDTWLTAEDQKGDAISATYTVGRQNKFRRWLVSRPDQTTPTDLDLVKDRTLPDLVDMLTLPNDPQQLGRVQAQAVETSNGRYAWWITGENQKALVAATAPPKNAFERLSRRSQRTDSGAEKLPNLAALPTTSSELSKAPTLPSLGLTTDLTTQEELKKYYHDLTVESAGVLANVRDGGLKQDLNLLLENDTLPAAFGTEDFVDGDKTGTIVPLRPYTEDVPRSKHNNDYFDNYPDMPCKPNFTSWYKLHQYYSLYKKSPSASSQNPLYGGSQPTAKFAHYEKPTNIPYYDYYGYDVLPVITRIQLIFSTRVEEKLDGGVSYNPPKYEFLLHITPAISLWNPYNVSITIKKINWALYPGGNKYRIYKDGVLDVDWIGVSLAKEDHHNSGKGHPMRLSENGLNQNDPIVMKPGESRIYGSYSNTPNGSLGYYTHGFTGADQGGGLSIPIFDGDRDVGPPQFYNNGDEKFDGYIVDASIDQEGNVSIPEISMAIRCQQHYNNNTIHSGIYSAFIGWYVPWGSEMPIIPDVDGERAIFPNTENTNLTVASIDYVLKSGEELINPMLITPSRGPIVSPDYRCKSFIHANPTNMRIAQGNATDRTKAMAQYDINIRAGIASELNPDFDINSNSAFIGSAISRGSDYDPQTRVVAAELPVVPVTSLASLMHFKLSPGIVGGGDVATKGSELYDVTPNQGLAFANSFAHPLVPADRVYIDLPDFVNGSGNWRHKYSRDAYDHAFFNNDALWDNWFCSGLTRQETGVGYFDQTRSISEVADDFIAGDAELANTQLRLWDGGLSDSEVKTDLINGTQPAVDSWAKAAAHLMLEGAFNVNSTSEAAWKSFLWGLRDTEINYVDPGSGNIEQASVPADRVVLSRFTLPASADEGADAGDPDSWTGIRLLTKAQVDKLAKECVHQVKLRGPFLNMADFVNRRLEDSDLGQVAALQAAIDWDEWNGHSPSAGAADSINGRFKNSVDLITTADVSYTPNADFPEGNPALPNPGAATGSRWTGIPGYVTQADLLKRIGNQVTVRDDTYRIRAYGEAKDSNGKVTARAWCEAVVQRTPEYLMALPGTNGASETSTLGDLAFEGFKIWNQTDKKWQDNPDLLAVNKKFGRSFKIKSFRWLNKDEI